MTTRAARNNTVRIETDIEKSREESNWTKVIELAEQLKEKSPHLGYHLILLILPITHRLTLIFCYRMSITFLDRRR